MAILRGMKLRGKDAFVPLSGCKVLTCSDTVGIAVFEAFLFDSKGRDLHRLMEEPDYPCARGKLLQLVFFESGTGEFLGKPEGFPLVSAEWLCRGDICDVVAIGSISCIGTNAPVCNLTYSTSVEGMKLRVFAFVSDSVMQSDLFDVGDLSGESGYKVSRTISDLRIEDNKVLGEVLTTCLAPESTLCRNGFGVETGKNEKRIVMIDLDGRP